MQDRSVPRRAVMIVAAVVAMLAPIAATADASPRPERTGSVARLVAAPLAVDLAGVVNARTFAAYTTVSGLRISDKVIRSANLSALKPSGVRRLQREQLRSIIDLRTALEVALQPDVRVPGATRTHDDVLGATPPTNLIDLTSAYRSFITDPGARAAFGSALRTIGATTARGGTVLFHCSAGKDRTGWLSAVLLTILGVDKAVVNADYLASNIYRHASPNDPVNGVNLGLLDSSFATANRVYGSFDNYVHRGLGLSARDIATLKRSLLLPSI
ncbi:MAG: tyrosine-protein phosphatase [Gordonia sp. (in: high G+C Gram-positive bacteria)]